MNSKIISYDSCDHHYLFLYFRWALVLFSLCRLRWNQNWWSSDHFIPFVYFDELNHVGWNVWLSATNLTPLVVNTWVMSQRIIAIHCIHFYPLCMLSTNSRLHWVMRWLHNHHKVGKNLMHSRSHKRQTHTVVVFSNHRKHTTQKTTKRNVWPSCIVIVNATHRVSLSNPRSSPTL